MLLSLGNLRCDAVSTRERSLVKLTWDQLQRDEPHRVKHLPLDGLVVNLIMGYNLPPLGGLWEGLPGGLLVRVTGAFVAALALFFFEEK